MDVMKVLSGVYKLQDAAKFLEDACECLKEGLGTEDVLPYLLESKQQGWSGEEIETLEKALAMVNQTKKLFSTTKFDGYNTWQDSMEATTWEFVKPVAKDINLVTLLSYFKKNNNLQGYTLCGDFEDHVEDCVTDILVDMKQAGMNLTIEDVMQKCDLVKYGEWIVDLDEKQSFPEDDDMKLWAYHLLTQFIDVVISVDGYSWENYDTESACIQARKKSQ